MNSESNISKKEIIRVALDLKATQAFETMTNELRSLNEFIKFHPSEFVSCLISDYLNFYFKADRDHLIAIFFDSHAYVMRQTNNAKGKDNFMEVMQQALEASRRIKAKVRQTSKNSNRSKKENKTILGDDAAL